MPPTKFCWALVQETAVDCLLTTLLRGWRGAAEYLPQRAHEHRLCGPALGQREKVVDAKALGSLIGLTIQMGARMHPGVFHVEARRIGIEDQVPPVPGVLQGTIRGEGQLTLEDRHQLSPVKPRTEEGRGLLAR